MKNTVKLLGLIAIIAVIGFSMTACEDTCQHNNRTLGSCTINEACKDCGEVFITAPGHNYSNWVVTKFTAPAEETGTCFNYSNAAHGECGETGTRPSNITDYYGRWVNNNQMVVEVTATKLRYIFYEYVDLDLLEEAQSYELINLTVTPVEWEWYGIVLAGYAFSGSTANDIGYGDGYFQHGEQTFQLSLDYNGGDYYVKVTP